ncbi:ABC transporter permease [Entomospira culicis]|uniref:ABC transporter permease n=1 Tax=Entomospira culicis TaxID=2719989 RepID=A0A968GFU4_9SPIO|nr:ABC transporter permease [Entomospira culicis]NIZ19038.1 ABC transporter permease [Entomospira culicis]NIZ69253.1 ABC transporter permease [Entomospira culicis]WDI37836.1 ABC transporter permease [Entomospira culicis]WDI39464.1 ABC transporter permease [Entomospira culicis]
MNIFDISFWQTFLPSMLMISAPIILTALGGLINEKSGIVNIGLEGLMGFGAFTAAAIHVTLEPQLSNGLSVSVALLGAALIGMLFSLIHAFATISLKGNQIISGTGLNFLSSGLTIFLAQLIFNQERTNPFKSGMSGLTSYKIYPSAFIALAVMVGVWYLLNKRVFGLRLRACGENPQAASGAGVNVKRMQYIGVVAGGALAGIGGATLVLTQTIQYTGSLINGTGFIALAAIGFGRWTVGGVSLASILFGSAMTYALMSSSNSGVIPREFFLALPYIVTVISLVLFDYWKIKRLGLS